MSNPIPKGYHSVTPYLACADAGSAILFYVEALSARELYRLPMPDGKIAHAELEIGNSRIMLSDEAPEWGNQSATAFGGSPIMLVVYAEDVDTLAEQFVRAGGEVVEPVELKFYGDRSGRFRDPEGYHWILSQHVEDVSPREMQRRMESL